MFDPASHICPIPFKGRRDGALWTCEQCGQLWTWTRPRPFMAMGWHMTARR